MGEPHSRRNTTRGESHHIRYRGRHLKQDRTLGSVSSVLIQTTSKRIGSKLASSPDWFGRRGGKEKIGFAGRGEDNLISEDAGDRGQRRPQRDRGRLSANNAVWVSGGGSSGEKSEEGGMGGRDQR